MPDTAALHAEIVALIREELRLTGPIPECLGLLPALDSLYLSYNKLTGTVPQWIAHSPTLCTLVLNDNKLSGVLPKLPFANFTCDCDLRDNQFACPLPPGSDTCKNGQPTCS